ncbi:phosphoadenosine phosphosulfate reductase domain-containing protein [Levilinea saccharolytica]|uniref:Phosphoadenosine phosphosulfate reductase n=1 Tax=Levilinea saccharolytica TaxID=229921 RepID=A0A0P6X4L3_9CHLR|nr:phosphoadenosine phosphosulfate reductase family protein [Levilinea saccharolytica]KPL76595.1 phosphoadenosine phosphosulfate reductase [Levilinea saccharolytica]GAP17322.1 3'-phosphoadenosine 5'-phosphosulfate sulfotransferase (PAPS reductase)/FAD synthetase [Levilinea saccharolytica]
MSEQSIRHILSLSGGKDSAALAVFMKDKVADIEYVFCDTDKELDETYEYLKKLEVYLGKKITYLRNEERGFDELLQARRGFLPSPQVRWCTQYLKIKPFEKYIGDSVCYNYIGIRADENRKGYISSKQNIIPKYPFIEAGIRKADVVQILEDSGLGLPSYYEWRSRSGCYFCFFQQRIEWVGLYENHRELYDKAMNYERVDPDTGERYTWGSGESLAELMEPERIEEIKKEHERQLEIQKKRAKPNLTLAQVFDEPSDDEDGCLICHL